MQRAEYGGMRGDIAMLERADADADVALEATLHADASDLAQLGGAFHDSAWVSAFLSFFGRTQEARFEDRIRRERPAPFRHAHILTWAAQFTEE